jgi:hypothetical protein
VVAGGGRQAGRLAVVVGPVSLPAAAAAAAAAAARSRAFSPATIYRLPRRPLARRSPHHPSFPPQLPLCDLHTMQMHHPEAVPKFHELLKERRAKHKRWVDEAEARSTCNQRRMKAAETEAEAEAEAEAAAEAAGDPQRHQQEEERGGAAGVAGAGAGAGQTIASPHVMQLRQQHRSDLVASPANIATPQQQQQQQQQLTSLLQQRDILLANEPDTRREGDKWLDWKRAVEEVEAHIAAEGVGAGTQKQQQQQQQQQRRRPENPVAKSLRSMAVAGAQNAGGGAPAEPRSRRVSRSAAAAAANADGAAEPLGTAGRAKK